jgi:hypothetical protein
MAPDRPLRRTGRAVPTRLGLLLLLLAPAAPLSAAVEIDHDPVKRAESGQRIAIRAEIDAGREAVREARAYFKSGHDTRFWFAPMRPAGRGEYLAILPAPALGAGTVDYQIYAVAGAREFVKSEVFSIRIDDDEEALARAQAREPTDVEIDLDRIEQFRDLAERAGEPDAAKRVEVRNDVAGSANPSSLPGFADYIVMAYAPAAAGGAGLAGAGAAESAGGFGFGKLLVGAAAVGGLAVAADQYASDDDEEGGGLSVTLRNSGVDNIHICVECTGSQFGDANRIAPGQSRSIRVDIPAGQQSLGVRFNAGRNGVVRASAVCTVERGRSRTVRYTETSFNVGSALRCE